MVMSPPPATAPAKYVDGQVKCIVPITVIHSGLSKEVRLQASADWLKLNCRSEGGEEFSFASGWSWLEYNSCSLNFALVCPLHPTPSPNLYGKWCVT